MGADYREPTQIKPEPRRKPVFVWVLVAAGFMAAVLTFDEVVEWKDGEPRLTKKRERQMQKELRELQEAEQYALIAKQPKFYRCLKCPVPAIFLNIGEVWKYGVTRKGQDGRYHKDFLVQNDLDYLPQFRGSLHECLEEEKRKIFQYPLLPENLIRPPLQRLAKPPGNLRTD